MSEAYREYPFHISVVYASPVQWGAANILYPTKTGYSATMWGIPYDDVDGWRGPYPPEVLATQFEKIAAGWRPGIAELTLAVAKTPADRRNEVQADLRFARAAAIHFQSVANQTRFVQARDALANSAQYPVVRRTSSTAAADPTIAGVRDRIGKRALHAHAGGFADRLRAVVPVLLFAVGPGREGGQLPLAVGAPGGMGRHDSRSGCF